MWLMMSAGPSWLPRTQTRRKSSRSELRRMTFRQAKCRLVSRLKFRSSKMSPLMTSSSQCSTAHQELLEQLRLANVAAQVQVADDDAVVVTSLPTAPGGFKLSMHLAPVDAAQCT